MNLNRLDRFEIGLEEATQLGFHRLMGSIEYWIVKLALKKCGGNKARAAKILKMNRTTLVMKCQKYGFSTSNCHGDGH